MDICFVTELSLNSVWQTKMDEIDKSDLLVFGFNGLGLVSYKKELSGETEYFHDAAKLSKQLSSVVICGCDTDNYGVFRHSALVADKGKILGISDMAHSVEGSEFTAGGNFRVYDTSAGKIGVVVGLDLYFPETIRVLALCDADIIVCVFKNIENSMPFVLMRAAAFSNGVAVALCAEKHSAISNIKGELVSCRVGGISKTSVKIEKDYRLINSRRRGLYKDFDYGY